MVSPTTKNPPPAATAHARLPPRQRPLRRSLARFTMRRKQKFLFSIVDFNFQAGDIKIDVFEFKFSVTNFPLFELTEMIDCSFRVAWATKNPYCFDMSVRPSVHPSVCLSL
ncbi:hypothetical protein EVAR_52663_1 [Eumeta japonica]|uniref:Uncharacterized protein n=1 Tax=Eumeta variegata TaxID=151549 RepID=A0A4C1YY40_EUMVA|nr:hypothetical protein EVAR_52663_1 [Eumeta japonica]